MGAEATSYLDQEIPTQINIPELGCENIDEDHLVEVLFYSFYFSQSDRKLQIELFYFLVCAYGGSEAISHFDTPNLLRKLTAKVEQFIARTNHLSENDTTDVPKEVKQQVYDFFHGVASMADSISKEPHERQRTLVEILIQIIGQDLKQLRRSGGRVGRDPSQAHRGPFFDPWLSHVCYYGLLDKPAPSDFVDLREYNTLFSCLKQLVEQPDVIRRFTYGDEGASIEDLKELIARYNERHLEEPVDELYLEYLRR